MMQKKEFNIAIDYWIKCLDSYTLQELRSKPSLNNWSLGQLYLHLINDTNFFIGKIDECINSNENEEQEAHDFAKQLFRDNAFPDITIEGNTNNSFIPQPETKEQLKENLLAIKNKMNALAEKIDPAMNGKSPHPGLGYFNATEWIQFATIHFNHHVKQQKKIEAFLGLQ